MLAFLKRNKLPVLIVLAILVIAAVVVLVVLNAGPGGPAVYVQRVGDLQSDAGLSIGRYAGIVESQKIEKIKFDASKTIGAISVEAGQKVSQGDVLFTYNTQVMQLDVEAGQLEIDSLQATVTTNSELMKTVVTFRMRSSSSSPSGAAWRARIVWHTTPRSSSSSLRSTPQTTRSRPSRRRSSG